MDKKKKVKDNMAFWKKIRPDIELEETQYGSWKVFSDDGNYEEGLFSTKQEALQFIKDEFTMAKKKLKKVM